MFRTCTSILRALSRLFPRTPARPRFARPALSLLEARLAPAVVTSWEYRGSGGGGSLFNPSISPHDPNEVFLGSDMGQVFHTTNNGTSWGQLDFRQIQGFRGPDVRFTNDPDVLFGLDYTSIDGSDAVRPSKSVDGGATWTRLANDPTGAEANRFYVDFNNPSRLLLSDYGRLYASQDGGTTWSLKYTAKSMNGGLWLGGAFFDGNNVYLGSGDGLLVSTNGGQSFALATTGGIPSAQGIASLAGAKQNGVTRLFVVTQDYADMYVGMETDAVHEYYRGVYSMDVGAGAWTLRTTGLPTDANAADPVFVAMAPNNIDVAYLGGGRQSGVPSVYKTTDGGASWSDVFRTTGNANIRTGWSGDGGDRGWGYGEYLFGIAVAPTDPNRVVITDLGFAHGTSDGGQTWDALYVTPADRNAVGPIAAGQGYRGNGLDNTTSWQVTWADAQTLIVSNSDVRGQRSTDGGETFGFGYTGHTRNTMYRAVVHPTTGVVFAATSSVHDMYKSTRLTDSIIDPGNGAVLYSADKGGTWQTLHDFNDPVMWVALDPTSPNRLYAAVANSTNGGIWVTNNADAGASSTWTKLTPPPRTQGHAFNVQVLNDGSVLATFSGRRTSAGAFTNSSGVFLSTDGGQTWLDRTAPAMQFWTKDVVVDPADATQRTWYAGVWRAYGAGGPFTGGLYKTTDRGVTWTKVLDLSRVTSITIDPNSPDEAYVTTEEEGLWYTSDLHAASPTFSQVASYGFKQPERVFFNPNVAGEVWVTSFGGGLFVGNASQGGPTPGTIQLASATYGVNESAATATITLTRTGGSDGAVSVGYTLAGNTATAGADFSATGGTVTFAAGQTSATISVPITDDTLVEGNETFRVTLANPAGGATLGAQTTATATITDNDAAPAGVRLKLASATYSVRENAGFVRLLVQRVGDATKTVGVRWRTYDIPSGPAAWAGADYVAASGTLTFAAGVMYQAIQVRVTDDTRVEANEIFGVWLEQPAGGATLADADRRAIVTITENDSAFVYDLAFFDTTEGAGVATITVRRVGSLEGAATVGFYTSSGTARPGADYTTTQGTLSFAAGAASKTFAVSILDDVFAEGLEQFGLGLRTPTGGVQLGAQTYAKVRVADND